MPKQRLLRAIVDQHLEAQVEHLCRVENRSTSGMVVKLVKEALAARAQAASDTAALVAMIRGTSDTAV
jgi:hypothetical protein